MKVLLILLCYYKINRMFKFFAKECYPKFIKYGLCTVKVQTHNSNYFKMH